MKRHNNIALEQVYNDWAENGGVFNDLDNQFHSDLPWHENEITSMELDYEYYGNHSGSKNISPLVRKLLDSEGLSDQKRRALASLIWHKYQLKWSKLWDSLFLEYNPIHNYDRTETRTTTFGKTSNNTKSGKETDKHTGTLTDSHSGTDTNVKSGRELDSKTGSEQHSHTGTIGESGSDTTTFGKQTQETNNHETENYKNAYNSINWIRDTRTTETGGPTIAESGTEGLSKNNTQTFNDTLEDSFTNRQDVRTYDNVSDQRTLNLQDQKTNNLTDEHTYNNVKDEYEEGGEQTEEVRAYGNIGVTTTDEMLGEYRKTLDWQFFAKVFEDIDSVLTINTFVCTDEDYNYIDSIVLRIPIASETQLGGIKVGANLTIEPDGTLNALGGGGSGSVDDVRVNGVSVVRNGIARVTTPTKTSDLTNDSGFVNQQQAAAAAPVKSVNGKTGVVQLDIPDPYTLPVASASRLGGVKIGNGINVSSDGTISASSGGGGSVDDVLVNGVSVVDNGIAEIDLPTNTSDLTNDSGFVNQQQAAAAAPVQSVNGQTGAVQLTIPAAQIQSDWDQTNQRAVDFIKNKPAIPTKTSDLTNDSGFVNQQQAAAAAPVKSVNGKTGAVQLTIPAAQIQSDWGQTNQSAVDFIKNKPAIPTKTSDLTNDSGFVNQQQAAAASPVQSVNGQTGAVQLDIPDPYTLPVASASRLGGVKIGNGINVSSDGTISASSGGGGSVDDVLVNGVSVVDNGIAEIDLPTKTSDLTNDSGFVNQQQAAAAAPVQSVNGQTGAVQLTIPAAQIQSDWDQTNQSAVDFIKNKPAIPTKTSDLTNDSGFVNQQQAASSAPVQSVNGQTGAVQLTIPAAQIQSDWDQTNQSAVDFIKNKPAIPTKTSDLTNDSGFVNQQQAASSAPVQSVNGQTGAVQLTIPAAQIQSDWSQTNQSAVDFIKNKPAIPSPYVLPIATVSQLGGVKIGSGITVSSDGTISASGGGGGGGSYDWNTLTNFSGVYGDLDHETFDSGDTVSKILDLSNPALLNYKEIDVFLAVYVPTVTEQGPGNFRLYLWDSVNKSVSIWVQSIGLLSPGQYTALYTHFIIPQEYVVNAGYENPAHILPIDTDLWRYSGTTQHNSFLRTNCWQSTVHTNVMTIRRVDSGSSPYAQPITDIGFNMKPFDLTNAPTILLVKYR